MNKRCILRSVLGAIALLAWSLVGTVPASQAGSTVHFTATDEPGSWFKCDGGYGCVNAGSQSLAVIAPLDTVQINNGQGINNSGTDTTTRSTPSRVFSTPPERRTCPSTSRVRSEGLETSNS